MLQTTERVMPTYKFFDNEFLVGFQRWQAVDLLGSMGRDDEAQILGGFGFSRHRDF
jgi:hypothetical protein